MKTLFFSAFSLVALSAAPCQPPTGAFDIINADIDADGVSDAEYRRTSISVGSETRNVVLFTYGLRGRGQGELLRGSQSMLAFQPEQPVSAANPKQANDGGFNALVLSAYYLEEVAPGVFECSVDSAVESVGISLSALIGLRVNLDDGPHYGWIRFTRPDTEPSTPFAVAGYNYHPLPNEPISAGQPPTPPPLTTTYDETAGTLSLNWDPRFPSLALEYTESLTEPVEWKPVPEADGPPAALPVPETDRFYRLRTQ